MQDENDMTAPPGCPEKESLVALLYGEVDGVDEAGLATHVQGCEACAVEMAALGQARESLAAWTAPALARGFEVVPRMPAASWRSMWRPAMGYAAAAALVLGISAGLANLEVQYDQDGFSVRTGWASRATDTAASSSSAASPLAGQPVAVPSTPGPSPVESASAADVWRTEMAAMEARLRRELGSRADGGPSASPAAVPASVVEGRSPSAAVPGDWIRQVQRLVDESEVRQQQNLALRISEVSRDFELHRRADLVEVQQGLGQLGIDATQHKQMWDYFRRVSQEAR